MSDIDTRHQRPKFCRKPVCDEFETNISRRSFGKVHTETPTYGKGYFVTSRRTRMRIYNVIAVIKTIGDKNVSAHTPAGDDTCRDRSIVKTDNRQSPAFKTDCVWNAIYFHFGFVNVFLARKTAFFPNYRVV